VLKKAAGMGYKQFSYLKVSSPGSAGGPVSMNLSVDPAADSDNKASAPSSQGPTEIAFLTTGRLDNSHFGSPMLDLICHEMSLVGYSVTIYRLLPADIAALHVPDGIRPTRTAGIICAELLDPDYCRMAAVLGYPIIFVDFPVYTEEDTPDADILLMDNEKCITSFIRQMKEKGYSRFGFMGDRFHCRSFFERYRGFRNALETYGLTYDPAISLEERFEAPEFDDYETFILYLKTRLQAMPALPDAFICANDFNALDLITALRGLGKRIPEDVMILGFDDSPESRIITPTMSTVHIHSQAMGILAVRMLLSRIKEPDMYSYTIHAETTLVLRASTDRESL
jgi:LacI family transcriptional regulator